MSWEFFIESPEIVAPGLSNSRGFPIPGVGDVEIPIGGGGSGSDLGKQAFDAGTLALDTAIPGLGLALRSVWSIFGGGSGRTPTLDFEEYEPIAKRAAAAVSQKFQNDGIYDKLNDGSFHSRAINFVGSHNPGRSHERIGIIADMNGDQNVYGDLFRSLAYQLSGVSRDPNDITGVQWRVNQWLQDLVYPQMQSAGGGSGLPTLDKLKKDIFGGDSKTLLIVGAAIIGLFFLFKLK